MRSETTDKYYNSLTSALECVRFLSLHKPDTVKTKAGDLPMIDRIVTKPAKLYSFTYDQRKVDAIGG
jgi:hypothetical protein